MPSRSYTRLDHAVLIAPAGDGVDIVATAPDGGEVRDQVPREALERAARGDGAGFVPALTGLLSAVPRPPVDEGTIVRTTVEVGERAWAAIPFERFLPPGGCPVRVSRVQPRVLQVPLAFPIRVLETGTPLVVREAIEQTFHGTYRADAFVDAHASLDGAAEFLETTSWPTADILHVHDLRPGPALLSTARSRDVGTVGWLLRFADRFQTRLIVLEADAGDLPVLRLGAQAIIDRGGPAVWLFERSFADYANLYGCVAHDRPLDWIRAQMPGELFAGAGAEEGLRYSGIGTALSDPEILRDVVDDIVLEMRPLRTAGPRRPTRRTVTAAIVKSAHLMHIPVLGSTIQYYDLWGTRAERFGDAIRAQLARQGVAVRDLDVHVGSTRDLGANLTFDSITRHVQANCLPLARLDRDSATELFTIELGRIGERMPLYEFESHESDGMLPLAGKIDVARAIAEALRTGKRRKRPREPRHVNTGFWTRAQDGSLTSLPQATARLKPAELVHFGVRIAPKETGTVTLGSTLLLEEQIRWQGKGAWIEIGVTAIDFDLLGDPVQEIWLPREDPTDLITFAVRPRPDTTVPGVVRLRVAIYHRNNVVQSFLVAALLESASGEPAHALARALDAEPDEVRSLGEVGYLQRLEYATAPASDAPALAGRDLTIIANRSAGERVVTIKGDDLFGVTIDPALPDKVKLAREALDRASRRGATYRYTYRQQVNNGDPAELLPCLWDIAEAGFDLFNLLVRDPEDQRRVRDLIARGRGIHAAHIDAATIIPWSLVYDRPVIRTDKEYENPADANAPVHELASAVCPASMPASDGTIPAVECGGRGCLLNTVDNEQRKAAGQPIYREHTVICPRRFWGFMVPIEVPAQQVDGLKPGAVRGIATAIAADEPVTVVGGFNPNLEFAPAHAEALEGQVFCSTQAQPQKRLATLVTPAQTGPEPLRQLLLRRDPDIVYFYCHALAALEQDGKTYAPGLDFGRGFEGVARDVLAARAFAGEHWTHAPLVFINGCSTAGFSPYAPSEFIKQFIQGRGASAVIGTEVTVWEALATEVATSFLRAFLDHKSAGEALLLARRALLAKSNPLGLVYTLYGSADLVLRAE